MGSSPLRSDGSRNGQVGEAGPVEQCSAEAKSLKTKGQGTVQLPPQWATTEAARWGPEGQIKDYSHDNLLKETSNGQSKQSKKSFKFMEKKKERRLLYAPILNLQWGKMSSSMKM